jgi:hypothetical protein
MTLLRSIFGLCLALALCLLAVLIGVVGAAWECVQQHRELMKTKGG